jgi:hypothetical protein
MPTQLAVPVFALTASKYFGMMEFAPPLSTRNKDEPYLAWTEAVFFSLPSSLSTVTGAGP